MHALNSNLLNIQDILFAVVSIFSVQLSPFCPMSNSCFCFARISINLSFVIKIWLHLSVPFLKWRLGILTKQVFGTIVGVTTFISAFLGIPMFHWVMSSVLKNIISYMFLLFDCFRREGEFNLGYSFLFVSRNFKSQKVQLFVVSINSCLQII